MECLDRSSWQICLVVDGDRHLLGTVTDGDIRRRILKGQPLDAPVTEVMNARPIVGNPKDDRTRLLDSLRARQLKQLPIVDHDGRVVGLETLDHLASPNPVRDNWVVLMAGGLGTRLRPLTEHAPKPLLRVGNRPILETILLGFVKQGFHRFYISVNYKAEMVKAHFDDGDRWGVTIRYLEEDRRLGTAGALTLIEDLPELPLIVSNGDLLTKVDFNSMLDFHDSHGAEATMGVREYDLEVPFGVVQMDQADIVAIEEKPVQRFFVNAGLYVIGPSALPRIPRGKVYDMPTLFGDLISAGGRTVAFPIREYWLDIGRMSDLERAKLDYLSEFEDR